MCSFCNKPLLTSRYPIRQRYKVSPAAEHFSSLPPGSSASQTRRIGWKKQRELNKIQSLLVPAHQHVFLHLLIIRGSEKHLDCWQPKWSSCARKSDEFSRQSSHSFLLCFLPEEMWMKCRISPFRTRTHWDKSWLTRVCKCRFHCLEVQSWLLKT